MLFGIWDAISVRPKWKKKNRLGDATIVVTTGGTVSYRAPIGCAKNTRFVVVADERAGQHVGRRGDAKTGTFENRLFRS